MRAQLALVVCVDTSLLFALTEGHQFAGGVSKELDAVPLCIDLVFYERGHVLLIAELQVDDSAVAERSDALAERRLVGEGSDSVEVDWELVGIEAGCDHRELVGVLPGGGDEETSGNSFAGRRPPDIEIDVVGRRERSELPLRVERMSIMGGVTGPRIESC